MSKTQYMIQKFKNGGYRLCDVADDNDGRMGNVEDSVYGERDGKKLLHHLGELLGIVWGYPGTTPVPTTDPIKDLPIAPSGMPYLKLGQIWELNDGSIMIIVAKEESAWKSNMPLSEAPFNYGTYCYSDTISDNCYYISESKRRHHLLSNPV